MLRSFYFYVVVWGEGYVDRLLNFCIPSLLAPGNLPSLAGRQNKLLVVTPRPDWEHLNRSPVMRLLERYLEPVHLELPPAESGSSVYDRMSHGHKMATQAAFMAKAYGVFLAPDMMLSDGSVAAIQRHAQDGVQVVLTAALRYGEEPFFEHLAKVAGVTAQSRYGDEGRPLSITARQMAYAAVNGFHAETLRFEWDAPYFAPFYTGLPGVCWWRIPGEDGVLLHSSSWAPLLVDYAALAAHDSSTMDHWAIDGDYIHQNFGVNARIHVVQDSDEIMLVSWTPMAVLDLPRKPKALLRLPLLGEFIKGCLLRDAFLGPYSDPLKRKIFFLPVRFHSADIHPAWRATEMRAQAVLDKYLTPHGSWLRILVMRVVGGINRLYVLMVGRWANRRHVWEMIRKALQGDSKAKDYLKRRTKLYFDQIVGKPVDRG